MSKLSQVEKVKKSLEEDIGLRYGSTVLMGVSGGSDSVCLLMILNELREELGLDLKVIHVEHGIRGQESLSDAAFTENLCKELGVDCLVHHVDVPSYKGTHKVSEEEAARILRYRAFEEEIEKYRKHSKEVYLAVAHHKEDNAETIMLQLLRGTGLKGMSGLDPKRDYIIRPLLSLDKAEILSYLEEKGQTYCTDSTNSDRAMQRNRLRLDVFPVLNELNPRAVDHIVNMASDIREAEEYLSIEAESWLRDHRGPDNGIDAAELIKLPHVIGMQVLLVWLRDTVTHAKDISRDHMDKILFLAGQDGDKQISLPDKKLIKKVGNRLFYTENKPDGEDKEEEFDTELTLPPLGESMELCTPLGRYTIRHFVYDKGLDIPHLKCTKWFDYDRIKDNLHLRTRHEEDYFVINKKGDRQLLRRYLINEKIPRDERGHLALFTNGNEISWAVGYRTGNKALLTDDSKEVIEITWRKTKDE